jgi:hypothetical protein
MDGVRGFYPIAKCTVHKERNSGGLPFGKQYNNNDLFGHIID